MHSYWQAPATHPVVFMFGGPLVSHTCPQEPQFSGSVSELYSSTVPSQSLSTPSSQRSTPPLVNVHSYSQPLPPMVFLSPSMS